jgi:hypothetical protein
VGRQRRSPASASATDVHHQVLTWRRPSGSLQPAGHRLGEAPLNYWERNLVGSA